MESNQRSANPQGGIKVSTKVQKWGNSLAVRIPSHVAEQMAVYQGTEMELTVENQTILLRPKKKKPSLEELLSQCTPEKRHEEIDFGRAGRELL